MAKPQSYFKTLGNSFILLTKFPQLFIPLILGFIAGLILTPFTNRFSIEITESGMPSNIGLLILIFTLLYLIMFIIYGWQFSMLKQIFKSKKVAVGASFKCAFPMAWKLFKTGILSFLIMILFFLALTLVILIGVGIGIGVYKLNAIAGIIISVILGLIGFGLLLAVMVLSFFALCYTFQLVPALALEDQGAWATLKNTYYQFRRDMGFWCKNGILSFIIIALAEIPYFIYLFMSGAWITPSTSLPQIMISQAITIPIVIIALAVQVAYCFFYKAQK